MITFDKIVNKLLKKGGKILLKDDIFELYDPEKKPEYTTNVNKIIYNLKSKGVLKTIRNGVYIVPSKEDEKLNEIDLIEKYYYKLVKKYITSTCANEYYISGKKSLEIHLKNYSIPEKLVVVNRKINKKIMLGDYCIIFKTLSHKEKGKTENSYSKISKLTTVLDVEDINFRISNLELSVVENAIISDNEEGIDIGIISKALKKYAKFFNKDNFYHIGELKFIMAFNRLKELSRHIDNNLYLLFLDIIKKNGGLFIGEGLRKI